MIELTQFEKLNSEFRRASRVGKSQPADRIDHLSELEKKAWAKLLSSVASAEAEEEDLVRPLAQAFASEQEIAKYIELHAADEHRHGEMLRRYVKQTFNYVKKKASMTDTIIYHGIFPIFGKLGKMRPLPFIGALYCYELFAELLYSRLRRQAEVRGLPHLADLCGQIQKDELRHVAGIKTFLTYFKNENKSASTVDLVLTKSILSLVATDINFSKWALHNRHVRENMLIVGIDPDEIYSLAHQFAKRAMEKTMEKVVVH